jgi:hypothetical protein
LKINKYEERKKREIEPEGFSSGQTNPIHLIGSDIQHFPGY